MTEDTTSLKCIVLKQQSLKMVRDDINKLAGFQNLVYTDQPELVAVSEPWLHNDIKNDAIPSDKLYKIHLKDRPSRGGGVLLAVVLVVLNCKPHVLPQSMRQLTSN